MSVLTKSALQPESLSQAVKDYIAQGNFEVAERNIASAMASDPHDAAPHNLMGILMEHENLHPLAMKHFRAAWALDPTFRPARFNMDKYAESFGIDRFRQDAYEDSDCPEEKPGKERYKVEYDCNGTGHFVKR